MALHQTWKAGTLIRQADDVARIMTTWTDAGTDMQTRPFTVEENLIADSNAAARAVIGNEISIRDRLSTALATNTTYGAMAAPTAAQTTAQVKALTRQLNALIRLANRQLDSDS